MPQAIDIVGISADGTVSPAQRDRIVSADLLAGGERLLALFPSAMGRRFVIKNNLEELVSELRSHARGVVLASGDPLFHGIGAFLIERLGSDALRIEPALGSMQLAFARAGLAWHDAAIGSIHGRDLRTTLLPLLGKPKIGLFTQDGDSPAAVAQFFLRHQLPDYEATVGENLGAPTERITRCQGLAELVGQRFAPLNFLVLRRRTNPEVFHECQRRRALVPGVPDDAFARPEVEVMTRQEVRAVTLAKLSLPTSAGDIAWDIGAGLGTVTIELAVSQPHLEVVAVERDATRAGFLRENRQRFDAWNVRIVEGSAPEQLLPESNQPRLIFLGGSGQQLDGILELIQDRLLPGGRLVANFVTLENLMRTLERVKAWGWSAEITEIHISRGDALAGSTGLKPLRGVFMLSADRLGVR